MATEFSIIIPSFSLQETKINPLIGCIYGIGLWCPECNTTLHKNWDNLIKSLSVDGKNMVTDWCPICCTPVTKKESAFRFFKNLPTLRENLKSLGMSEKDNCIQNEYGESYTFLEFIEIVSKCKLIFFGNGF